MRAPMIAIAAAAASSLLLLYGMTRDEPAPAALPSRARAAPPPTAIARAPAERPATPAHETTADGVHVELAALHARRAPREQRTWEEELALDRRRTAARTAVLEKAFASDRRDPSWSLQAESKLRSAFAAAQ